MSIRTGPAGAGDNSDPAKRPALIRAAIAELVAVAEDRKEANGRFTKRANKARGELKALDMVAADYAAAIRIAKLKQAALDAENEEDRERIERKIKIAMATFTECYAAIEETGQLSFNEILNDGAEARAAQKKAPEATAGKVKGGAKKSAAKTAH